MHLLLDPSLDVVFGEIVVQDGSIQDLTLTPEGKRKTSHVWKRWYRSGIDSLRTARTSEGGTTRVAIARESTPLSSPQAFFMIQQEAPRHGFLVFTLDDARAPYWREIEAWPMVDHSRGRLLFMLKNLPEKDLPTWKDLWTKMVTGVLA